VAQAYRDFYEELGTYTIYTINNNGISYKDVLELKLEEILELSKNKKDKYNTILKKESKREGFKS